MLWKPTGTAALARYAVLRSRWASSRDAYALADTPACDQETGIILPEHLPAAIAGDINAAVGLALVLGS